MIGKAVPIFLRPQTTVSNERPDHRPEIKLKFAPAAASLIIEPPNPQDGQSLANDSYNPNQLRVPSGQSTGGQWTSGGTGTGAQASQSKPSVLPIPTIAQTGANQSTPKAQAQAPEARGSENAGSAKERAAEATKLRELAEEFRDKAQKENTAAAFAFGERSIEEHRTKAAAFKTLPTRWIAAPGS